MTTVVAEWSDDDGKPLHPVAYSVGGYHGPILPRSRARGEAVPALLAKLGPHAEAVDAAFRALPEIKHAAEYDWQAREREERRERECFALSDDDADAARAFGCLLELGGANGRDHRYVTDAEWLADRLGQKIAAHVAAEEERTRAGAGGIEPSGGRAATTRRRRRDASSGSATTRHGWLRAAATSTLERRSRGGSRSSTPTR